MLRIKTKRRNGILWGIGATLTAAAIFGVVTYKSPSPTTNATGEAISAGSPITGRVNQQIAISDVSISGTGNDVIPVKLQVGSGSLYMTKTTGLTFTSSTTGSNIDFSGTRSQVNTALATLHYAGTTAGSDTLTVSLADQNTIYNPTNGHVYQYVPTSGDWWDARDAAAASTYDGLTGYLATITSSQENNFIKDRLNGDAWLGASDDSTYGGEGHWEWVVGPEAGTNFYNGEGSGGAGGGTAVGGDYTDWAGPDSEPNNAGGNENCMETYIADGTWNDLPCDDPSVSGYVVEYGGNGTNPGSIPTADVSITTTAATFAGGDGSSAHPYQITDCERLQDLNQDLTADYVLTHNIDCTDTPNWNGGQGFVPIGTNHDATGPFTGTIDGAGYSIDGLTEIRADDDSNTTDQTNNGADYVTNQDYVGLIGFGSGATINDVHLTHAKIKGYEYVGGLIGLSSYSTITDSSVNQGLDESASTSCAPGYCVWARYGFYGGGLIGYMSGGSIDGSTVGGLVKGSGNVIGGLVGHMEGAAAISNSGSTAALDGGSYIGGAVGEMYDSSTLNRVYATGNVLAKIDDEVGKVGMYGGGLVGYAQGVTISESYATGNVHVDDSYAGGLVGGMFSVTANDVYSAGNVTAVNNYAGGIVGASFGNNIARAYASGQVSANVDAGGLTGLSDTDTISDSFAAGHSVSPNDPGAFTGNDASDIAYSHDYFDATTTQYSTCTPTVVVSGCTVVNMANSQPTYLFNYSKAPFTQTGSRVWDDAIWYFDGTHYPVLRMGTNNTISQLPADDDNDGVSSAIENAAPNSGDGNNDGIQDSTQANVVSLVNPVTNKYVTLEVDSACNITAANSAAEPATKDGNYSYPLGLLNYTVNCGTPGFSTTVKIYYQGLSSADGMLVRKYNATTGTYTTIPSAVVSGSNPVVVTYTLTDGGALDQDGTANGIIIDPVGLAAPAVSAPNTGLKPENISILIFSGIGGVILVSVAFFMLRRTTKNNAEN